MASPTLFEAGALGTSDMTTLELQVAALGVQRWLIDRAKMGTLPVSFANAAWKLFLEALRNESPHLTRARSVLDTLASRIGRGALSADNALASWREFLSDGTLSGVSTTRSLATPDAYAEIREFSSGPVQRREWPWQNPREDKKCTLKIRPKDPDVKDIVCGINLLPDVKRADWPKERPLQKKSDYIKTLVIVTVSPADLVNEVKIAVDERLEILDKERNKPKAGDITVTLTGVKGSDDLGDAEIKAVVKTRLYDCDEKRKVTVIIPKWEKKGKRPSLNREWDNKMVAKFPVKGRRLFRYWGNSVRRKNALVFLAKSRGFADQQVQILDQFTRPLDKIYATSKQVCDEAFLKPWSERIRAMMKNATKDGWIWMKNPTAKINRKGVLTDYTLIGVGCQFSASDTRAARDAFKALEAWFKRRATNAAWMRSNAGLARSPLRGLALLYRDPIYDGQDIRTTQRLRIWGHRLKSVTKRAISLPRQRKARPLEFSIVDETSPK